MEIFGYGSQKNFLDSLENWYNFLKLDKNHVIVPEYE